MRRLFFLLLLFSIVGDFPASGSSEVRLIWEGRSQDAILDRARWDSIAQEIVREDPIFRQEGPQRFRGVPLKTLLAQEGVPDTQDLTIIAEDQYMTYLPAAVLRDTAPLLAFSAEGAPIPASRGGPLKILFPASVDIHPDAGTWYVRVLVAGSLGLRPLRLETPSGDQFLEASALATLSRRIPSRRLPFPRGYNPRHLGAPFPTEPTDCRGTSLDQILTGLPGTTVWLHPLAGPDFMIPRVMASHVTLVSALDERPLEAAFGGPFLALFDNVFSADAAPEARALFFLEGIRLE